MRKIDDRGFYRILGSLGSIATIFILMLTLWDYGVLASAYYESEITGDIDGLWGEEIIIEYSDGSTDSLKILEEQILFGFFYQERPISSITYRLSLNVDYDSEVDTSMYECDISTDSWETTKSFDDRITIAANEWIVVASSTIDDSDELPVGEHTLLFCNKGVIKIRDYATWTEIKPPDTCKDINVRISITETFLG